MSPTDILYLNVLDRTGGGVDSFFKPIMISDIRSWRAWDMPDDVVSSICMHLEKEINLLKSEISEKNARVKSLEQQLTALHEYNKQFVELHENYDKEQDRLTKLYHEYERSEEEIRRLKKELEGWKDWVESNKDLYDRLFQAAPPKMLKTSSEEE